jgi:hypothetical protein
VQWGWKIVLVIAIVTTGCTDWVQVRSAREIEAGQRVKIERNGQTVVFDDIASCDKAGFIVAKQWIDCRLGPPLTFDTRQDKVFVYDKHTGLIVGLVVLGVATTLFATFLAVGSAFLSHVP